MNSKERAKKFLCYKWHELTNKKEATNILMKLFNEHAAEQRQNCADDAFNQCQLLYLTEDDSEAISDACLNATGEENENN